MKYFTKILLSLMCFMFIMGLAYNYKQSRDDIYNYKLYNDSINKLSSVIEIEESTIFNIDYKYGNVVEIIDNKENILKRNYKI